MAGACFRRSTQKTRKCCILLPISASLFSAVYIFTSHSPSSDNDVCANETVLQVENRVRSFNRRLSLGVFAKYNFTFPAYDGKDFWRGVLHGVYIYSAYLERRSDAPWWDIRFIGIVAKRHPILTNTGRGLKCRVRVDSRIFSGKAELSLIPEDHGYEFSAAFIQCMIKEVPAANCCSRIEVALENSELPLVWLKVHNTRRIEGHDLVSVCVRPQYGPFDNLVQLVEFLTYYSVVGVSHFSFYITGESQAAYNFLRFLRDRHNIGIKLHSWNLPIDSNLIHAYGQLAFTQDCIYRAKRSSKYVAIVDLDEFIVPKLDATLPEALTALEQAYSYKSIGSFSVMNRFFCLEYSPERSLLYSTIPLLTRLYTIREKHPWEHRYRSKYMARTNATAIGGVHFIWKYKHDAQEIQLPEDVMVMHHYRSCCGLTQTKWLHLRTFSVLQDGGQVDDTEMQRFTPDMLNHHLIRLLLKLIEHPG